jgi:hypothetical protein
MKSMVDLTGPVGQEICQNFKNQNLSPNPNTVHAGATRSLQIFIHRNSHRKKLFKFVFHAYVKYVKHLQLSRQKDVDKMMLFFLQVRLT